MRTKTILALIAILGLFAGALEYIIGRPDSIYFLKVINISPSYFLPICGSWGRWIPDFFHAFSFSLICIALFSKSRTSRFLFCLLWLCIDSLFEIGQRYGARIAPYIPSWFDEIFVFENTRNYFLYGTFDTADIFAISLGALMAFLISELIKGGGENAKGCKVVLQKSG